MVVAAAFAVSAVWTGEPPLQKLSVGLFDIETDYKINSLLASTRRFKSSLFK